jgi:hypothetical protein
MGLLGREARLRNINSVPLLQKRLHRSRQEAVKGGKRERYRRGEQSKSQGKKHQKEKKNMLRYERN